MTLTPSDLSRLEELARAATPGKRVLHEHFADDLLCVDKGPTDCQSLGRLEVGDDDGEFIAACDRETILSLVAMARRAPRWIPVEERMPEDGTNILAYDAEKKITWALRAYPSVPCPGWIPGTSHWMAIPEPPETTPAPILGRAEPAPPVEGRVGFVGERILAAEEVALFPSAFEYHGEEMLCELTAALREKPLPDGAYRIRISIEPEGR